MKTSRIPFFLADTAGDLLFLHDVDAFKKMCEAINRRQEYVEDDELVKAVLDGLRSVDYLRSGQREIPEVELRNQDFGVWDLWDLKRRSADGVKVKTGDIVARNPETDVVIDGVVGIDFGTKSTVVACVEGCGVPQVLRIDVRDLSSAVRERHFENPTAIEFRNLKAFKRRYASKAGRPYTRWDDLTVASAAMEAQECGDGLSIHTGCFSALKQWMSGNHKSLWLKDREGCAIELPPYGDMKDGDIDPIEIYAYHIGLAINSHQRRKIFLRYLISCPVSFPGHLRERLQQSFERGIRKSLPLSLLENDRIMKRFSVVIGVCEPQAYAVSVLQKSCGELSEDGRIYGVFDFGGGTTDFDFGLWRNPTSEERDQGFQKVLVHLRNGGDALLGGENLLEAMAFDVYGMNFEKMREKGWHICCPIERAPFPGGEVLVENDSWEGRNNLRRISEALRPFWEDPNGAGKTISDSGLVNVTMLVDSTGAVTARESFQVNVRAIESMLENRIARAVDDFLHLGRVALRECQGKGAKAHVYLAGNASRSAIVPKLFKAKLAETGLEADFEVHVPMESHHFEESMLTVKTGVAIGLLKTTEDSNILFLDEIAAQGESAFPFYVGIDDGAGYIKVFRCEDGRIMAPGVDVNPFDVMRVGRSYLTLYYTTDVSAERGVLPIDSPNVHRIRVKLPKSPYPTDRIYVCCKEPYYIQVFAGRNRGTEYDGSPIEINLQNGKVHYTAVEECGEKD